MAHAVEEVRLALANVKKAEQSTVDARTDLQARQQSVHELKAKEMKEKQVTAVSASTIGNASTTDLFGAISTRVAESGLDDGGQIMALLQQVAMLLTKPTVAESAPTAAQESQPATPLGRQDQQQSRVASMALTPLASMAMTPQRLSGPEVAQSIADGVTAGGGTVHHLMTSGQSSGDEIQDATMTMSVKRTGADGNEREEVVRRKRAVVTVDLEKEEEQKEEDDAVIIDEARDYVDNFTERQKAERLEMISPKTLKMKKTSKNSKASLSRASQWLAVRPGRARARIKRRRLVVSSRVAQFFARPR